MSGYLDEEFLSLDVFWVMTLCSLVVVLQRCLEYYSRAWKKEPAGFCVTFVNTYQSGWRSLPIWWTLDHMVASVHVPCGQHVLNPVPASHNTRIFYFILIRVPCIFLFCNLTNKCTIISQTVTILHVSTLSCRELSCWAALPSTAYLRNRDRIKFRLEARWSAEEDV